MFHLMIRCGCGEAARPKCRQNTAYANDDLNWVTLCEEHLQENAEHWQDMWQDYWKDVL